METEFYPLTYRLDGAVRFLIRLTNDHDGIVTDEGGMVPTFAGLSELRGYAGGRGLNLQHGEQGSTLFDLDEIVGWLAGPTGAGVRCVPFLDAWNLFDDFAKTLQDAAFSRLSMREGRVYDKLFWGCNLPSVTPPGERFDPVWSDRDVRVLCRVLSVGLGLFRKNARYAD